MISFIAVSVIKMDIKWSRALRFSVSIRKEWKQELFPFLIDIIEILMWCGKQRTVRSAMCLY